MIAGEGASGPAPSELRRSVSQATDRIHEIIDSAERLALEIRSEAEAEAERYLAARQREADRLASERSAALEQVAAGLIETVHAFSRHAEQLLGDLDRAVVDARAGAYRTGGGEAPEVAADEPDRRQPDRRPAIVAAYPGTRAADADEGGDRTAELLLRATQMAVTGKERDEIVDSLRADFPGLDTESIVDEVLG